MQNRINIIIFAILLTISISCRVSYNMSGVDVGEAQSFAVLHIDNKAPIFKAGLSEKLQQDLKEYIENQTPLYLQNGDADFVFDGIIKGYSTRPMAIQDATKAASMRFEITVSINFINNINPDNSFNNSTFTRYRDYDATKSLNNVEDALIEEIIEEIIEDIFKKALVNW